jgi:pimeloyl-ACP methyl ester carboxylesterase
MQCSQRWLVDTIGLCSKTCYVPGCPSFQFPTQIKAEWPSWPFSVMERRNYALAVNRQTALRRTSQPFTLIDCERNRPMLTSPHLARRLRAAIFQRHRSQLTRTTHRRELDMTNNALLIAVLASTLGAVTHPAQAAEVKNIVIVHGAFADSSGWRKTSDLLEQQGFHVALVQNPITSLEDDVAATRRVLDMQQGPKLLVGHSYGGMVITEAGNRPDVVGLVYVAAFQPDQGESLITLATSKPPASSGVKPTADGEYLYFDPAVFHADFAADLPASDASFMARSQVLASKRAFTTANVSPAWRTKKSWAIVATNDRTINPELERHMAKRAGSKITEIPSSHAVFLSHPEQVAELISKAARESGKD